MQGDGSIKITLAAQKNCSLITDSDTGTAFIGTGDYGYTYDYVTNSSGDISTSKICLADYENSAERTTSMKYKLNEWFNTNLSSVAEKLKTEQVCIGNMTDTYNYSGDKLSGTPNDLIYSDTTFYYKTYTRLYGLGQTANATLKCEGKRISETKIFPLTADEIAFAGGKVNLDNSNYYLNKNATSEYYW